MNITLRQLSVFESVARNLSFTKAAKELHLSQPGVSMQVRQLADVVGMPLFEKLGKQVHLTEAGTELYYYSQRIAKELQEMEQMLESLKGVRGGKLRISVATTANHFTTRLLAAFSRQYAGTDIALDVTNRQSLLDQLQSNATDIVIMGEPPPNLNLESEAFMENPLVVVAPVDHPLARAGRRVPLYRLSEETFVVREAASGTRIAMERFFKDHGVTLQAGMEMTSNEAIKQSVEAGLGLGIVSVHTIELELEVGRLLILDVEGFPILRHWHLVHLKGKRWSPVAQAFSDFLLGSDAKQLLETLVRHPG